ncbi:GNAT family N-acetyltransferase [Chromatocurvus halotolerans]|uniref:Putative GNAT family N-acyltransferase n=1 Tax=Chromatocurvus halotolerans TaxID=1132028 RepID=A0A4R2L6I3_9GAMM|nr:GNAT family N-acetyltransferase [Chromatocurvus halotolerans]TCO78268.1 putative GNAT family N-acyltransferase [Chromatocurvus halotolerans]
MSAEPLSLRQADWDRDQGILRTLRETVFVQEQGVPADIEWDGKDAAAAHAIAELGDRPVACGRLMPDGKIGRMAVLPEARNRGIGARIMTALIDQAMRRGLRTVYLHAQSHAAGFYSRQAFVQEGDTFVEAGIEHVAMRRELDYTACRIDVVPVSYPQPFAALAIALASTARRHLDILSPALDAQVFDNDALVSAMTALVRQTRDSRVRILVGDAEAVTSRGHRLLTLARRLPSSLHLRHLPEHPDWRGHSAVIRDRDGVLIAPAEDRDNGFFRIDDRAGGARHSDAFSELWRHASAHPGFRSLTL